MRFQVQAVETAVDLVPASVWLSAGYGRTQGEGGEGAKPEPNKYVCSKSLHDLLLNLTAVN